MRHGYWVDIYKIRDEILQCLNKCGIDYTEAKEAPPTTYSNRIGDNGGIAMICEDVYHPSLPTSFCTPYGKLKIVGSNGSFFRNASGKKVDAFLNEMTVNFGLVPIDSDADSKPYPAIAITRVPRRASKQKIALPIFVAFVGSSTWEEEAKAKRVFRNVQKSRQKAKNR